MKQYRFIELSAELEIIENELDILDPNNPIEQSQITLLMLRVDEVMRKVEIYDKEGRLSKFKIVKN